jgi:hypothetical protein
VLVVKHCSRHGDLVFLFLAKLLYEIAFFSSKLNIERSTAPSNAARVRGYLPSFLFFTNKTWGQNSKLIKLITTDSIIIYRVLRTYQSLKKS